MADDFIRIAGALYRACDPLLPASPEQYVDCAAARGGRHLAELVLGHLEFGGGPKCFLFAGQIGCGKSSEVRELARRLAAQPYGGQRYVPILVGSLDYLDKFDVTAEDVMLMLVAQLGESLRADYQVDLAEGYAASRWREFLELLASTLHVEEVSVSAKLSPLSIETLSAKLKLVRGDHTAKDKVRAALRPQHLRVRDLIEVSIAAAESALYVRFGVRAKLVLIVDDLEKVERFEFKDGRIEAQRQMFIERSGLLSGLPAVVVYSVSLDLARGEATRLQAAYGSAPFVLPMVKVFNRGAPGTPTTAGYASLRDILNHRARFALPGEPFDARSVFSDAALDTLIRYSGGDVRQLFSLVRGTLGVARVTGKLPVAKDMASYAVAAELTANYSTTIAESHWPKLVALDVSPLSSIANHDPDYLKLLDQLAILEYVNGSGTTDLSPWYAVHPALRDVERFKLEREQMTEAT